MARRSYPTDLSQDQWDLIEPWIPQVKPAGAMGAETIRAAPVRKRLARHPKNLGLSPRPLPHGRGSDRNPPPTGPSELSFPSIDTRTPYVVDYPAEGGGKTAHYMLRWVATTGEKGPWSETVSATIGA